MVKERSKIGTISLNEFLKHANNTKHKIRQFIWGKLVYFGIPECDDRYVRQSVESGLAKLTCRGDRI